MAPDAQNHPGYFTFNPTKMHVTPHRIQNNLANESFSAIPTTPIVVVVINTNGPTMASAEFTNSAFSMSLSRHINSPAHNSMVPEINRNSPIAKTM